MKKMLYTVKVVFDKEPNESNDDTFERFKKVMDSLGLEWDISECLGMMEEE